MTTAACNAIDGRRVLIIDVLNGVNYLFGNRLESIVKYYASIKVMREGAGYITSINDDVFTRIEIVKVLDPWNLLQILTNVNIDSNSSY